MTPSAIKARSQPASRRNGRAGARRRAGACAVTCSSSSARRHVFPSRHRALPHETVSRRADRRNACDPRSSRAGSRWLQKRACRQPRDLGHHGQVVILRYFGERPVRARSAGCGRSLPARRRGRVRPRPNRAHA
jgi:hypothetical protein